MKEEAILFRKKLEDAQYQLQRSNEDQQNILGYINRLKCENASLQEKIEILQSHTGQLELQISDKNQIIVQLENEFQEVKEQSLAESLKLKDELENEKKIKAQIKSKLTAEREVLAECQQELSTLKPQYKDVLEKLRDCEEMINSE